MTACSSKTREAFQLAMASINLTPEQSDTPVEADPTSRYLRVRWRQRLPPAVTA